ncbi:methyltransferase, FxLD system [Streptomonospora sp. S1-112]|uniref:Protein-L-isoaspartate O-methyltransferase n=1 Tax=Streptomonospora mangrovi TaxID=2883123 RepID=A0A9X3SEQ2_9ACTN|nr:MULTISPECIES: methyltransferase, FxLD system [Streptomonospora]MDA0565197.1 methyltransferase, FxLD system [Streptomonospora mangrovi]
MPSHTPITPEQARQSMVEDLIRERVGLGMELPSPRVESALRSVPRDAFLPGLPLTEVYDQHQAVVTKRDPETDVALSSVSAPSIIATMLQRADLRPGHRVLEIGSGGYNAALIRHLVGERGQVTSIDIDPEVVDRATRCLKEAGLEGIHLAVADGEHGYPDRAPYDRVIATAGAWDFPPAWDAQVAPGGRVVVPMRVRGLTRCLTLERGAGAGRWRCVAVDVCGFVRMQGAGEHWEPMPLLHEAEGRQVGLRLEDGPSVDVGALRAALAQDPVVLWSSTCVGGMEPTDSQDLYMACAADGWALLTAQRGAVEAGILRPVVLSGTPAVISDDGTSFAYRCIRGSDGTEDAYEFGAVGHGPRARHVAHAMVELISDWGRHHRGRRPKIDILPASTPREALPSGRVLTKRHTHTVLNWTDTLGEKERH